MQLDQAMQNADSPPWKDDEAAKRAYGIELARLDDPFEAALKLFNNHTKSALWVIGNWVNDPLVQATKSAYKTEQGIAKKLLDKDQLAAKLLSVADEKHPDTGLALLKAQDRLSAYKLYSEIMGYIGSKSDNKNQANVVNEIKIKLVSPSANEPVTINAQMNNNENDESLESLPIKVKLVG